MKIATIVGARPQFIKISSVSPLLRNDHNEILIHTGQHYDYEMSKLFFDELHIPAPEFNLGVGSGNQGEQTGKMMISIEEVLLKEMPDLVLVYGDTNSTLAGALCASKLHIPLGHIEAGLRSFDKKMPEEINRILTDHSSDLLFCPTQKAIGNLCREGMNQRSYLVGDVMYDAALRIVQIAEGSSRILETLRLKPKEYILATVHRAENTDNKSCLNNIVEAFLQIEEKVVLPLHPRTKKYLDLYGLYERILKNKHILIVDPVGYCDILLLEKNAKKILTDSGGVQKEAYFFRVPCITLRENTEWVETVDASWNVLVGNDIGKILDASRNFEPDGYNETLYGDGKAGEKICRILDGYF
ncbi:MAG: UDP-N-acetylglucosamine 2-epimerase (non-hydrolyzing) [Thermodesulfobacteriota bacterium]|nr:UDP-N-acetylglucosamine 2-epimerase (non-hydrolyzing) [Thermodesulfobacteriota bacterium]